MTIRFGIAAAVFGLMGSVVPAGAQPGFTGAVHQTGYKSGSIASVVRDPAGAPVVGALVSAVGTRTITATTDAHGRCTLGALPAGQYLVRVHHTGFNVAHGLLVTVTPGQIAQYSVVLKPLGVEQPVATAGQQPEIVAAGFVPAGTSGVKPAPAGEATSGSSDDPGDGDDHSETAWWLRHLPRSVLKDAVADADVDSAGDDSGTRLIGHLAMPASTHASFLSEIPFSGQINLLTTSTFDTPEQLLSDVGLARGVAYVSIGAAAGRQGDWNVQAALTQGDMASWMLAGSFVGRPRAGHRYRAGMTYAAQRYAGANPAALASVADGTRNAGALYAYDTWTVSRRVTLDYGGRYATYGYIDQVLFSPRAEVTIRPTARTRVLMSAARRLEAPGALEFVPGSGPDAFLPPERTFAPLIGNTFTPERTTSYQASLERDVTRTAVVAVRTFYQRTDDQVATIFGLKGLSQATGDPNHYFVANAGDFEARGWAVRITQVVGGHLRGSIDYAVSTARWSEPTGAVASLALIAPSTLRLGDERLHDLTTSVDADIPQLETHVFALYRLNSAFAGARADLPEATATRFDVQVTQPLPFLNFTSAQWEALFGIRSLFGENGPDGSMYDELLVVRPPKRVVGGVTVRF